MKSEWSCGAEPLTCEFCTNAGCLVPERMKLQDNKLVSTENWRELLGVENPNTWCQKCPVSRGDQVYLLMRLRVSTKVGGGRRPEKTGVKRDKEKTLKTLKLGK